MERAVKGLHEYSLNRALLVFLCLILGLSSTAQAAYEFHALPGALIDTQNRCAIVNIYSLVKNDNGDLLQQEGVGWVTYASGTYGVLTPYHVVANADLIVAHCRGQYFPLELKQIDAEKDIAFSAFAANSEDLKKLYPLVYAINGKERLRFKDFFHPQSPVAKMKVESPAREYLQDMSAVMLGMSSFGVALPPEGAKPSSLLASPIGDDRVQGLVDKEQGFAKQILRIENLGIRPGLSGGALFGVLDSPFTRSFNEEYSRKSLLVPLEFVPKVVLGMVIKTRLNGAETVALSVDDIYDFLENKVLKAGFESDRDLRIKYRVTEDLRLQSYISLNEGVTLVESCSDEYKISADLKATAREDLQKLFADMAKKKSPEQIKREQIFKESQKDLLNKQLKGLELKKGGGEYGEGGDGFALPQSVFLTSKTFLGVGKISNPWNSSFGLYLNSTSCRQPGLWTGSGMINAIKIPGQKLQRMTTYEDVRHLYFRYGRKTAGLIRQYGVIERQPYFTQELTADEQISLPLTIGKAISSKTEDWKPGDYQYFRQRDVIPKQKSSSFISVSSTKLKWRSLIGDLSNESFTAFLQLSFENSQWQGFAALSKSCQLNMKPEYFFQAHPWLLEYRDGKNHLSFEMGTQGKLISAVFKKVDCFSNLALGELEVLPNSVMTRVQGTDRKVLVVKPLNFRRLIEAQKTEVNQ